MLERESVQTVRFQERVKGDPWGISVGSLLLAISRLSADGTALIVLSAVSILVIGYLTFRGNRRKAAVGRVELRTLLVVSCLA
jgi:hypothetical protein